MAAQEAAARHHHQQQQQQQQLQNQQQEQQSARTSAASSSSNPPPRASSPPHARDTPKRKLLSAEQAIMVKQSLLRFRKTKNRLVAYFRALQALHTTLEVSLVSFSFPSFTNVHILSLSLSLCVPLCWRSFNASVFPTLHTHTLSLSCSICVCLFVFLSPSPSRVPRCPSVSSMGPCRQELGIPVVGAMHSEFVAVGLHCLPEK